jgi:hypothetical protein
LIDGAHDLAGEALHPPNALGQETAVDHDTRAHNWASTVTLRHRFTVESEIWISAV